MIEITLLLHHKELDLAVPNKLAMGRLKELIRAALQENGMQISEDFRLRVKDKLMTAGGSDVAFDFGLAGGDRLEVVWGKNNAVV